MVVRVFASWSGGKDSCLALHRAISSGFDVDFLFTMLSDDGLTSASHGLTKDLLEIQSRAVGIPIIYGKTIEKTYEEEFKMVVGSQIGRGIEGAVFGDINLQVHRDWIQNVSGKIGIKPFFPLWKEDYDILLREFMHNGFEAIVVSAKTDLIGEEWIGKPFDWDFVRYLDKRGLDRLGEKGEYHTFVTNGPIFKQRIRILEHNRIMKNNHWLLDKLKVDLPAADIQS